MKMKIGITGGIGSGKTTVCKYIESLGYQVFYSDLEAIKLANTNSELIKLITDEFGTESYINGEYNRKFIVSIVFESKKALEKLNQIFKPFIDSEFKEYCNGKDFVIYESALIFEHNQQSLFDVIICVVCPINEVIRRLERRNGFDLIQINKRISAQLDPSVKMSKSHYIIDTMTDEWKHDTEIFIHTLKAHKH